MPRRFLNKPARLPDDVYVELVELMFSAIPPVALMGVAVAAVGAVISLETRAPAVIGLTAACVLVCAVRIAGMLAFRRRAAAGPLTVKEAEGWERIYAGACLLFALLLGAFSACALASRDPLAPRLVIGLIFGYGAGLITRTQVRPLICTASLALSVAPTVVGLVIQATQGHSVHHVAANVLLAVLVAAFAIGSLETMTHGYRTTLRQLLTKRSLAGLVRKDALTGLPNRVLLREKFDEDVLAVRKGGDLLALHFLDLDRFKAVNDRYGHPVGDELLKCVAERLTGMLRATDTAARLGGDEFVVVQNGVSSPEEASMLARRIIRKISAPYHVAGQVLQIGASVGIALAPQDGVDLEQLARCADAALYEAKRNGRGGVAFWTDIAERKAEAA